MTLKNLEIETNYSKTTVENKNNMSGNNWNRKYTNNRENNKVKFGLTRLINEKEIKDQYQEWKRVYHTKYKYVMCGDL